MGLKILYAKQAIEEQGWENVPDTMRLGRLREVYWARRAEGQIGKGKSFIQMGLHWWADHENVGRVRDDPGDSFVYKVKMMEGLTERGAGNFEWIEVTEVFTTTPPRVIQAAMRTLNGIKGEHIADFDEFRKGLKRRIPSRWQQRDAADDLIESIKKKIRKTSYNEVVEKYGYGTLVIGMPLWFAMWPKDPYRAENALDDFMTRTSIGIEEIKRNELRRSRCPFKHIIILWDTTPEAIEEWDAKRSREYEDVANTTFLNPMTMPMMLAKLMQEEDADKGERESATSSFGCFLEIKVKKKKEGKGPYPELIQVLQKMQETTRIEQKAKPMLVLVERLRASIALVLCKVLCFMKIHGIVGLEKWAAKRISPKWFWRKIATKRRGLRLYKESVRRGAKRKKTMSFVRERKHPSS